jgi:hypothetical protein
MFGLGKPPPSPPPLLSAAGDYDQTAVAYVVILYAIYALYRVSFPRRHTAAPAVPITPITTGKAVPEVEPDAIVADASPFPPPTPAELEKIIILIKGFISLEDHHLVDALSRSW